MTTFTAQTSHDGHQSIGAVTTQETAYCFAHQGRATMTVTTFRADRQEKVVCDHCGAEGYGPAVQDFTFLALNAKDLQAGDVILTQTGHQNEVTTPARHLGGTGLVTFGLKRQDRDPWEGRLDQFSTLVVVRPAGA